MNAAALLRRELRSRRRRERVKRDENIERCRALPGARCRKWRGEGCAVRQNISNRRDGRVILLGAARHVAASHSGGVMVTMLGRVRACGSGAMVLMNRAEAVFAAGWSGGPRRKR